MTARGSGDSAGLRFPRARRLRAGALAVATIAIGLAVHRLAPAGAARDITGDALWAAMLLWWVTVLWPTGPRSARAGVALAVSWAVEVSQRSSAPWLAQLRATWWGPLVLGTGFDPRDLLSYTLGVLVAWAVARRARL